MLSKPGVRVLISLITGHDSLKTISENTNISVSWVSSILGHLANHGFCKKERKGNVVRYFPNEVSPVQKLIKLINTEPRFDFENFLSGLNVRILGFCVFSPKTTKIIAKNLNTSVKAIQNRMALLQGRGLLVRKKNHLIAFNPKMYLLLEEFLKELRLFSEKKVNILWKFEERMLFETQKKEELVGILTGFSRYSELEIPMYLNIFCNYFPKKILSKEEIFIHSILEINHAREIMLALTFYLKHKLNERKIADLAQEYDCLNKLEDLKRILKQEKTEIFPLIKEKELKEFFQQYDVKWGMKSNG